MMAKARLNNENEIMICYLRYNNGGLDKSSPYINMGGLDESSTCIKIKMGLMSQTFKELTIFPGGIR
jgi:hypothetical protein